ncbi:hypothetical protein [Rhodoplanes sp. Z2-YC6860]|uniref:hypothetical protein n=1 Tax=Rhodoplanes sp. Z2-YC6860 TaxID=674703 RepID=UPI0012ED5310|nr:hypothetical protein [Rhodoplanes sp. Z2-YC6860]
MAMLASTPVIHTAGTFAIFRPMIPWDFDGRLLGRFREWLNRTPGNNWDEASSIAKVGRVVLIALALAIMVGVPIYLFT